MRNIFLLCFLAVILLLGFEDCRREPLGAKSNQPLDSIYVGTKYTITVPFGFPDIPNPYKDSLTNEGILLGRRLFYDKHLSSNGQMACASCHFLQHCFSDSVPLAANVFGLNTRNAPSLVNLAWEPVFFWDGRAASIPAQAQNAAQHELGMNVTGCISYLQADSVYQRLFKKAFGKAGATITANEIYLGIQEFLMTVVSANSRFDSVQRGEPGVNFNDAEYDAFYNIFTQTKGECFHCHAFGQTLLMVDWSTIDNQEFRNNGLQKANTIDEFVDPGRGAISGDSADYGKFKNPTLRNIAVSGPYMHDGRYKTLAQVINFYSDSLYPSPNVDPMIELHINTDIKAVGGVILPGNQPKIYGGMHFTAQQKAEMLELLNDFTDTSFLDNPAYKNPFTN